MSGEYDLNTTRIISDPVLDEVTQTPLILAAVASLFEVGDDIPKTKMGVLGAFVRLQEKLPQHSVHLGSKPLRGLHSDFLIGIAVQMTVSGQVTIHENAARAAILSEAISLQNNQQIASLPEPSEVLSALCAHHLLERIEYPSVAFRFAHQQYQEYYAAIRVKQKIDLVMSGGESERRIFASDFLNSPAWDEPIGMVAEKIGVETNTVNPDVALVASGRALVEIAMDCDLVFSAELFRLCGPSVWREIGPTINIRLRSWYSTQDECHQRCALAAILVSGYEAFKDLLIPLLSNPDEQIRLRTYRLRPGFHTSSLGRDWQQVVGSWTERARANFVSEILHNRYQQDVVDFVAHDRSRVVREAALHALAWNRFDSVASRLIEGMEDTAFGAIANSIPPDLIPHASRTRAIAVVRQVSDLNQDVEERLSALLRLADLGESNIDSNLKSVLGNLPAKPTKEWAQYAVRKALEILRPRHSGWVSDWVSLRIADQSLWPDQWMHFVSVISPDLLEVCLRRLETEDFQHGNISGLLAITAAAADETVAARIFSGLRRIRKEIHTADEERGKYLWSIGRQLETTFRKLPPELGVSGILSSLPGDDESIDVETVSQVFSQVARQEAESISSVGPDLKSALHKYLKQKVGLVLAHVDYSGELKADFASVLSQVGNPDDIGDLNSLIRSDIDRLRRVRAARNAHESGPLVTRGGVSYATWNIRTLLELNSDQIDSTLFDLLKEPEYEREVAEEIPKVLSVYRPEFSFGNRVNYEDIWAARAGLNEAQEIGARRKFFADALRESIRLVLEERHSSRNPGQMTYRLMGLVNSLALIDGAKSSEVVFEILLSLDSNTGWQKESALRAILFSGGVLPASTTVAIVDSILARFQSVGIHENERGLVNRLLCILPFVDPPSVGIQKIREIISKPFLNHHDLSDVVSALGYSRCEDALNLLVAMINDPNRFRLVSDEWVKSVARIDTISARELLMGFLEPGRDVMPDVLRHDRNDLFASTIFGVVIKDPPFKSRLHEICSLDVTQTQRLLLAKIMRLFGTPEAHMAALNLIDDNARPQIPYDTFEQIEEAFVERKPDRNEQNSYTLSARASNQLRSRLFEMAIDDPKRKRSAVSLLGQIEEWRIEYGRPLDEPRHPMFGSPYPWPPLVPKD